MHDNKSQEIFIIILIGIVIGLLLVGFILTIFFLYQRKKLRQEQELVKMKDQFGQELLRSQLEIQESTLKVIAQELHDNIGQMLSVIKLGMAALPINREHAAFESLDNSRQLLNKTIYDLADLTKSLHTDRIASIGLLEAIRFEVVTLRKMGLVKIELDVTGTEYNFDDQKSIFLFRMFQEIMNNILKHAEATIVTISIDYTEDHRFFLKVADDGVGFNVASKQTQVKATSGIGLKSMVNRAKLIGASIEIQSQPGRGTSISVDLPFDSEILQI